MQDKTQIKKTWRNLLLPFFAGILLLLAGILWNRLGSKSSGSQAYSFFLSLFGAMLAIAAGSKIIKFRKYLKDNHF